MRAATSSRLFGQEFSRSSSLTSSVRRLKLQISISDVTAVTAAVVVICNGCLDAGLLATLLQRVHNAEAENIAELPRPVPSLFSNSGGPKRPKWLKCPSTRACLQHAHCHRGIGARPLKAKTISERKSLNLHTFAARRPCILHDASKMKHAFYSRSMRIGVVYASCSLDGPQLQEGPCCFICWCVLLQHVEFQVVLAVTYLSRASGCASFHLRAARAASASLLWASKDRIGHGENACDTSARRNMSCSGLNRIHLFAWTSALNSQACGKVSERWTYFRYLSFISVIILWSQITKQRSCGSKVVQMW